MIDQPPQEFTRRDHFAAAAITGLLANPTPLRCLHIDTEEDDGPVEMSLTEAAYKIADEMIRFAENEG